MVKIWLVLVVVLSAFTAFARANLALDRLVVKRDPVAQRLADLPSRQRFGQPGYERHELVAGPLRVAALIWRHIWMLWAVVLGIALLVTVLRLT
jgi:hypothetical protein